MCVCSSVCVRVWSFPQRASQGNNSDYTVIHHKDHTHTHTKWHKCQQKFIHLQLNTQQTPWLASGAAFQRFSSFILQVLKLLFDLLFQLLMWKCFYFSFKSTLYQDERHTSPHSFIHNLKAVCSRSQTLTMVSTATSESTGAGMITERRTHLRKSECGTMRGSKWGKRWRRGMDMVTYLAMHRKKRAKKERKKSDVIY